MPEKNICVKYKGVGYPLVAELTERERYESERMTGQSLDTMGIYTQGLCVSYFTLRRAGVEMTFDAFLDVSGFEITDRQDPPPDSSLPAAAADGESSGGDPTETDGTPAGPPPSGSTPG